jgi:hypothetical protein
MDIFNRERVAELERKLAVAERDRDNYRVILSDLENALERASNIEKTIPEDCKKGPWCKACEFARGFRYREPASMGYITDTVYVCGKGESCQNFVPKNMED